MASRYRYYCLYRPPAPGAIPSGIVDNVEYDDRRYCPQVDCFAWGYVEYDTPLTPQEVIQYELMAAQNYIKEG